MPHQKHEPPRAQVIDWLMAGDPAIRWQVMRDLLHRPKAEYERERQRIRREGWGERFLSLRDKAGTWGRGAYAPKWVSTTFTLLTLRAMGLSQQTPQAVTGARLILNLELGPKNDDAFIKRMRHADLCVNGLILCLLSYFKIADERIDLIAERLLSEQMEDGGWNCARLRHNSVHSSFHTTLNVLDGLSDYAESRPGKTRTRVHRAMRRAEEFMLQHRLFRSDKTGQIIKEAFTQFSFPPRWHYDALRGLEHFRTQKTPRDNRLQDAITLLHDARGTNGHWKLRNRHPGIDFFQLEKVGQPSRWNTLRALRVLKWWNNN